MPLPFFRRRTASVPTGATAVAEARPPMTRMERWTIFFLVMFVVVFPKGGIKVADTPLTWGYLALLPAVLAFPLALYRGDAARVGRTRVAVLAALVPFQLIAVGSFMAYGVEVTGWAVAFVMAFFFLPLTFLLAFAPWVDRVDLAWVITLVRRGMLFVAVYGIFLFFWKIATGSFLEIPFLTVNQGDLGQLEGKHINRGAVFKLISTYNNGNLYGISLLILLPLYCWAEKSPVKTSIVKLSLLLTLSRTVWIGLLLHEVAQRLYVRRVSVRTVLALSAWMTVLLGAVWWSIVNVLGFDPVNFILDANLGGRAYQLRDLEVTLLPAEQFGNVAEMVYVSILRTFGVLGLVSFLLAMTTPIALHLLRAVPDANSAFKRTLVSGLVVYLVISMSDGGLLFIPIMAFYWFVVSLLVSPNRSWAAAEARPEPVVDEEQEGASVRDRGVTLVPLRA